MGNVMDITFHPSQSDAQMNLSEIDKNTPYTSANGTIWARIEDPNTSVLMLPNNTRSYFAPAGSITNIKRM